MKHSWSLVTGGWMTLILLLGGLQESHGTGDLQATIGWRTYLESSDGDDAAASWKQALKDNPNEAIASVGLALAAEERGDIAEALAHYHQALQGGAEILYHQEARTPGDKLFYRLLAEYALAKLFYLRPYREERDLFSFQTLKRLEHEGVPPRVSGLYRYYLARQTSEQGEDKEAERILMLLNFAESFLILGPFDNQEEAGLNERFPPEEKLDLSASYRGKAREVKWRDLYPPPRWGYVDLGAVSAPSNNATVYALTALHASNPTRVTLRIAHAGAMKLWVGSDCVVVRDAYHAAMPDQVSVPVDLPHGWSPILLKVCSKTSQFGFYLRFEGDGEVLRWWDGSGDFPAGEGIEFDEEGPAWQSAREQVFAEAALMPSFQRALAYLFHASGRRAFQNLDENDHEDLECYRAACALFPNSSLFWRYRGIAETDGNAARLAFEKSIELNLRSVLAREFLAEDYLAGKTPALAEKPLNDALRLNPEAPALWSLLGRFQKARGCQPLAHNAYRRACELAPHNSDYREDWIQSRQQVMTKERITKEYRDALTAFPGDRSLRVTLITSAIEQGYVSEAEALIREGLRLDPYDKDLYLKAIEYYRAVDNFDRAQALAKEGLRISPEDAEFNRLMGLILHEDGKLDEAKKYWGISLVTKPQDTWLEEYRDYHSPDAADYYLPFRIDAGKLEEPDQISPLANSIVLLDHEVRKVHENGASSYVIHRVIKVLTDAGSRANQTDYIYYEPQREKVKIKRARVTRQDGTYFDAPAPKEYSAVKGGGEGARVFGDYYVKALKLPAVEKGVTIDLEYEVEQMADNLYADYFGDIFYIGDYDPTVLCEYVLITPASRGFHSEVIGAENKPAVTTSPDGSGRVYRWTYRNLPLVKTEPEMPATSEILPYVKVSTFDSWDKMGSWYWDLIKDRFTMTPQTRLRAREILAAYVERQRENNPNLTEELLTDLDRVRAVNRFVNTEVRYLGLEFGINGYRPHRVSEICNAQYGDCKDKATLAIAFLKELGVEGRIALLRTRDRGNIDYSLASLGLFNHAIVYLPDVDGNPFVLDGTAQFYGTAELPAWDQGIDLLVIGEGGSWEFVPSPVDPSEKNGGVYRTSLELRSDGSATGKREIDFRGLYNVSVRNSYQNRAKIKDKLERTFGQNLPGTTVADIEISDLDDPETNEWLHFRIEIPQFAESSGVTLSFKPVIFPYEASKTHAYLEQREHDLVIIDAPWFREKEMTVEIPDGYRISSLPEIVDLDTPFGSLQTEFSKGEGTITCYTKIALRTIRVAVEDYPALRNFCRRIDEAEESRIVLTKAEG